MDVTDMVNSFVADMNAWIEQIKSIMVYFLGAGIAVAIVKSFR